MHHKIHITNIERNEFNGGIKENYCFDVQMQVFINHVPVYKFKPHNLSKFFSASFCLN